MGNSATGRHYFRRFALPGREPGRVSAGHDGWNPLEPVGIHARSNQNYSTPPRSVGKRERS
nr:MAG TPA: hypothetical protein [Caudoviricetes sp.]